MGTASAPEASPVPTLSRTASFRSSSLVCTVQPSACPHHPPFLSPVIYSMCSLPAGGVSRRGKHPVFSLGWRSVSPRAPPRRKPRARCWRAAPVETGGKERRGPSLSDTAPEAGMQSECGLPQGMPHGALAASSGAGRLDEIRIPWNDPSGFEHREALAEPPLWSPPQGAARRPKDGSGRGEENRGTHRRVFAERLG